MSFRFFNSTGQEQIINSVADLPVGAIIDSALPNAPTGWLLCDGSSISRTGFPELFAAIGTFYGSVDANTFTLPDLTGQIIYARPYSLRTTNGLYVDDNSITSAKIADGTIVAGDIANSTITAAKLAPGVGASLTAAMTPMTTERSTGTNAWTDVTGASLAYTVVAGTYLYIGYSCDLKVSAGAAGTLGAAVQVLAGTTVLNATFINTAFQDYYTIAGLQVTYGTYNGFALVPAAVVGTGSQAFKFTFRGNSGSGYSTFINNCYLTIQSIAT
jgi:microcystin-dependent protein